MLALSLLPLFGGVESLLLRATNQLHPSTVSTAKVLSAQRIVFDSLSGLDSRMRVFRLHWHGAERA